MGKEVIYDVGMPSPILTLLLLVVPQRCLCKVIPSPPVPESSSCWSWCSACQEEEESTVISHLNDRMLICVAK